MSQTVFAIENTTKLQIIIHERNTIVRTRLMMLIWSPYGHYTSKLCFLSINTALKCNSKIIPYFWEPQKYSLTFKTPSNKTLHFKHQQTKSLKLPPRSCFVYSRKEKKNSQNYKNYVTEVKTENYYV